MTQIDPKLLAQIACPACDERPPLKETPEGLYCAKCERIYPVRGGIPVLLVDEAALPTSKQSAAG